MRELKKPKRVVFPYQRRRLIEAVRQAEAQERERLERFIKEVDDWVAGTKEIQQATGVSVDATAPAVDRLRRLN